MISPAQQAREGVPPCELGGGFRAAPAFSGYLFHDSCRHLAKGPPAVSIRHLPSPSIAGQPGLRGEG